MVFRTCWRNVRGGAGGGVALEGPLPCDHRPLPDDAELLTNFLSPDDNNTQEHS